MHMNNFEDGSLVGEAIQKFVLWNGWVDRNTWFFHVTKQKSAYKRYNQESITTRVIYVYKYIYIYMYLFFKSLGDQFFLITWLSPNIHQNPPNHQPFDHL